MFFESNSAFVSKKIGLAKRPLHYVDFFCRVPSAGQVALVGDFNEWNRAANPMQQLPDGGWWLRMTLTHGHHQYFFLVDGEPMLDPKSLGTVRNQHGQAVSLVAVS